MAFGEETYTAQRTTPLGYDNQSETRKGYTGYEKDDESGLEFAQARYYNSAHGRFTSVDPLTASANVKDPQTFNRYSYVLNSPYKFTDPLGLISVNAGSPCSNRCVNSDGANGPTPFDDNSYKVWRLPERIEPVRSTSPPTPSAEQNNERAAVQDDPELKHNFKFQGYTYTFDIGYDIQEDIQGWCQGKWLCETKGLGVVPAKITFVPYEKNQRDFVAVNDNVNFIIRKMMSALKENEDVANSAKNAIQQAKGAITVRGAGVELDINYGLKDGLNVGLKPSVQVTFNNVEDIEANRLQGEDSIIRSAFNELNKTPTIATGSGGVPRILTQYEQDGMIKAAMKIVKPASAIEQQRLNKLRGQ